MLNTPALIGQYHSGMPVSNMTLGDGNVPVIWSFPIKDFSMLLRPNLWPYFIFNVERAFAFSWNFTIFLFLISTFFLFALLTESNFWLSLFGTFFIFLSGGMQWWSYSLGSHMIYLNGIVISCIYMLYSDNLRTLSMAGLIFLFGSYGFCTSLYPPWQVPLVYLYVAILIGFLIRRKDIKSIKERIWLRSAVVSIAGIVLLFFIYHYYGLIRNTYDMMMNTAYPGKRATNGGDLVSGKVFAEFFGMYMGEAHVPRKWINICEASGFMMFFPMIFYCIARAFYRMRKLDWQLVMLSAYVIVLLIWVLVGFPAVLSRLSLLSMSPVSRTLPVLGVANCILLICFLGNKEPEETGKFSWLELGVLTIAVFMFTGIVGRHINDATTGFFSSEQMTGVAILMSSAYLLIRYRNVRYTRTVLAVVLLGMNIANITIHPVASGLSSVLENPVVKATEEISRKEPGARWAVFGNQSVTNLLKANGINVFNGVKVVPILKDMAVLDPTGENSDIYNRYAHISVFHFIDKKDSIRFRVNRNQIVNDSYSIFMDPCSPRLNQLEVKYVLFTYRPEAIETRCMIPVRDAAGVFVYRRSEL